MEIDFVHDGQIGRVSDSCIPNDDPSSIGTPERATGFPVCTATLEFSGRGYRALFGWVQLVRYSDNASGGTAFGMDSFVLLGDWPAPYCWFGVTPTLFDAPWALTIRHLEWGGPQLPGRVAIGAGRQIGGPVVGILVGIQP